MVCERGTLGLHRKRSWMRSDVFDKTGACAKITTEQEPTGPDERSMCGLGGTTVRRRALCDREPVLIEEPTACWRDVATRARLILAELVLRIRDRERWKRDHDGDDSEPES